MRTLAVRGLTRLSAPGVSLLMPLVLGGAVLLGGAAPASAEGRVTFVQMTAQRCAESGACEWKLSCGLQGQQKELFAGKEARTKHSVTINQGIDVKTFPATVQCTVWEDDGLFGASWEEAGTGTVTVPSGGDYRLDIGNADQGMVRVRIVADSLEIGVPVPPPAPAAAPAPRAGARQAAPPAPLQFVGAFNVQKEGQAVLIGLEWDKFKARMDELSLNGIQIFAVSSFEHGGKRLWNGIFRPSGEEMLLLANQDSDKFLSAYKQVSGGRKRLVDLEVYPSGGQLQFAALYRDQPNLTSNLWLGQPRKDFQDKIKELASLKGQQVFDVEVYRSSGNALLYAGPFLQSSEATEVWTGLDQAAFQAKWNGLQGKEWKLLDVETYKDGNKRFFDAVARVGNRGDLVIANRAAFLARWRELTSKGLRLTSVDVYQD